MEYSSVIPMCFNSMKIKYLDYEASIVKHKFLNNNDKVNLFISFESILSNISSLKDVENKLILEKDIYARLISETMNLAAHYKKFFRGNGLDTNIFFYYTDITNEEFINNKYNDEYRSYYHNKFYSNPKYIYLGEKFVDEIFDDLVTICNYIEGVHFIKTTRVESSVVPYIISNMYEGYKNFIITNDIYDSQYLFLDNFKVHVIKRNFKDGNKFLSTPKEIFSYITGNDVGIELDHIINNPSFFNIILSCVGCKIRSIDGIKGIGSKRVISHILRCINDIRLKGDTTNEELIISTFPEDIQEIMFNNYMCVDVRSQYKNLSSFDIFEVENAIINRFDNNSLEYLNKNRFNKYQLMLQELTM